MSTVVVQPKPGLRASSVERERIARDLHDGVVQSLIATEMRVDLLRRQSGNPGAALDATDTLADVQDLLRFEVRKLRAQIEQLRSTTPPQWILRSLAEMIEGFQYETGIATTFSCGVPKGSIPRHISHEVLRIVEEALNNVRKHSGARKVEVSLSSRQNTLLLTIQDDGKGFDFTGRFSLAQLETMRKGPRVIRERIDLIAGELVLESHPDRGARLEIQFASNRAPKAEA